jgi:uncharacterized protein YcbK (DUF882 family)
MSYTVIRVGDQKEVGHFKLAEFHPNSNPKMLDDNIGVFGVPDVLIEAGNLIRTAINAPVLVNSTIRSSKKNSSVGGAKFSYHLPYDEGGLTVTRAVDFGITMGIKDIHAALLNDGPLAQELRSMGVGGIGLYDTFVHLDTGPVRMWDNRVSTKHGIFNPTIIYHNLMLLLKKKDEEEDDTYQDMCEGFFSNPWYVLAVCALIYYKLIR